MMKIKLLITLVIILLATSCQLFLGPQPDSSPRGIFDSIWNDFDKTYALFDVRNIDWNETYEKYSPRISQDMSDYDLFRVCAQMLNTLGDPHVGLISPFGRSDFFNYHDFDYDDIAWEEWESFAPDIVQMYLYEGGALVGQARFLYGVFKDRPNIGYIYIRDFLDFNIGLDMIPNWVKKIDDIVESLSKTDGLVLDVRNSWGGLGSNMDYIASRFASASADYIKFCTKNGPGRNDFSDPISWAVKPAGSRYTKPIVLLTNKKTISASEWFVMALLSQDHVTHAGEATWGAFSARITRPLINGWRYTVSVQKVTDMNGKSYEGIGISPNREHRIENTLDNLYRNRDMQLEYARDIF